MATRAVPMIHVLDVRATAEWYRDIGFSVCETYEDDGEMSFALLSFGDSEVMFNAGGRPSDDQRREVDLYLSVEDVDGLYEQLKDRTEVIVDLNAAFYGAREFTVRDLNGFWITFGQPIEG